MLSVIIPVYNGEKTIGKCLSPLLVQSRKPDEIIVVDDGSDDRTADIVKTFKKVTLLRQEHKGPAAARNLGAKKAKGNILLFTDSDCIPDKEWVSEMAKPFESKETAGAQGRYKTIQKGIIARFVQLEIEDRYDRMKKRKYIDFIGSYAAGYRKSAFLEFSGFDEAFPLASGEDPELSFKLAKAGHKMVFNDRAVVYHNHVDSLGAYLKQKFWRAYWRILLYRKHPGKIKNESYTPQTLKLQILAFYLCILSLLFSPLIPYAAILSLFSLLLLVMLTFPLSYKNFKKDKPVGLLTPFIAIPRTLVFGVGLIYGMVRL
jgi:glycosyltransferase involved in cell wall biosynthesis